VVPYEISAEHEGFAKFVLTNVMAAVGGRMNLSISLQLAALVPFLHSVFVIAAIAHDDAPNHRFRLHHQQPQIQKPLNFAPTKIEVSKSADMAYEIGTLELKLNDAQGNPTTTSGKYVVVWRTQSSQGWKAIADIFNTDR
jgi:hypothetical protein